MKLIEYTILSREKSLLKQIPDRLLSLEFKSDHSIKKKCLKWIVKKILSEVIDNLHN